MSKVKDDKGQVRGSAPQKDYGFDKLHGTILQQFLAFNRKYRKVSDILAFLDMQSDKLYQQINKKIPKDSKDVSLLEAVGESMEQQIYEFAEYFYDNFEKITAEARVRRYGEEDAFILLLADMLYDERLDAEGQKYLDGLPPYLKKEAETLCDTIFEIREDRMITVFPADDSMLDVSTAYLPKTIPRSDLDYLKQQLLFICAVILDERGVIKVSLLKDNGTEEIFGIHTLDTGMWVPTSKEDMEEFCTITSTGIKLEPEDNVVFTEIMREKF